MNSPRDVKSDPLCLLEDALAGVATDAGQMTSARGYLRDIAAAAGEAERSNLSRFAASLDGLLELVEAQADGGGSSGEILDFVQESLRPLRAAVADEPNADACIDAALDFLNAQWGEYLSLMGDGQDDSVWDTVLASNDSDPWADQEFNQDQTREEIDRILGSLGGDTLLTEERDGVATNGDPELVVEGLGPVVQDEWSGSDVAEGPEQVANQEEADAGDATEVSASPVSEPESSGEPFGETDRRPPQEPPPPISVDLDADLLEAYLDDASAGVGRLEQLVLAVEDDPDDESLHRQICRELHTLKGASASVGLSDLAAYLHAVEDYIDAADGAAIEIAPMLNSVDAVRRQITILAGQKSAGPAQDSGEFGDSAESVGTSTPTFDTMGSSQEESLRVKASRVDRLMDLLAELVILRNQRESRLSRLKHLHSELTRCVTRLRVMSDGVQFGLSGRAAGIGESQPLGGGNTDPNVTQSTSSGQSGSIVEIASDVAEFARTLRELAEPMEAENVTISQFTRQFRMELIEMRRMPVSGLFQRLNRAARDAARAEGRRIDFQLQGAHAGLDRSLQERLYEPLLHMVRNAVSHGIESPEDRRKAGKPETGTITLSAKGSATTLVIEVSDDGRGLDYEAIRSKALDKGLIAVGEAVEESRLARLIFHPGFSTRQETNAISGRGVGMDVVAAALQRMRAKIDVESRFGKGTTMRLTIPLRSVIEHVMVVRVSGRLYALPMQFVQASRPLTVGLQALAGMADAGHYDHPQDTISIVVNEGIRLRTLLGDTKSPPPEREHILLLGSGGLSFSAAAANRDPWHSRKLQGPGGERGSETVLIVDDVVGPEEVVVRSLPSLLKSHPILGGVTLSGAGEIVQLLDGQRLLDYAAEVTADREEARNDRLQPVDGQGAAEAGQHEPQDDSDERRVLIVDDSLSARRRLANLLKHMGYEVTEAGDGVEGIDRFRSGHFRFVLTDLEMPRLDGFGFLSEMKQLSSVPVAVVSSRNEAECRERTRDLGAAGYLVKPATEPALAELVAELESKSGRPA